MSCAAEAGQQTIDARRAKASEIVQQVQYACTQQARDGKTSAEHKERIQGMSDEETMIVKAEMELSFRDLGFKRLSVEYKAFPEWAFVIRIDWEAVNHPLSVATLSAQPLSFASELGQQTIDARKAKASHIAQQVQYACSQQARDGKTSAEHKERIQGMSDEETMIVKAEMELSFRDL